MKESNKGDEAKRSYNLEPLPISKEDILFCIDIDPQSITRFDDIKQSILLFVNAKLTINPQHRFAFATLSDSVSSLREEFSSEIESTIAAMRGLSPTTSSTQPDLTTLFQLAAREARKSRTQGRILRVILFYCRSAVRPEHQWFVNRKLFTLDIIYFHEKPGPHNCPRQVYDTLVQTLLYVTKYHGYIFEIVQEPARLLFALVVILLSHPQQRCAQEYIDIPKSLAQKAPISTHSE